MLSNAESWSGENGEMNTGGDTTLSIQGKKYLGVFNLPYLLCNLKSRMLYSGLRMKKALESQIIRRDKMDQPMFAE